MKKYVLIITIASVLLSLHSCGMDNDRWKADTNYQGDFDINYTLGKVMQYDEVNINGIDVSPYFSFFDSYRLSIHYTDSKISGITFSNGDIPFHVFDFEIPAGKVDAYLNTDVVPNELRIKSTEQTIAIFQNGEFSISFNLDCQSVDYKYTFKSVK